MNKTLIATAVACALLTPCHDALADTLLDGTDFRVRPLMGWAKFEDSRIQGDTGDATALGTKNEDVIGGIAASVSKTWGKWRSELEYTWRVRTDLNAYIVHGEDVSRIANNLESQAISINLYRYFDTIRGFRPYVTGGAGVVRHTSDADYTSTLEGHIRQELSSTEVRHTWNAGGGLVYETDSGWNFDVGYRYVALGEASTPTFSDGLSVTTGPYSSHDIAFTVRKIF